VHHQHGVPFLCGFFRRCRLLDNNASVNLSKLTLSFRLVHFASGALHLLGIRAEAFIDSAAITTQGTLRQVPLQEVVSGSRENIFVRLLTAGSEEQAGPPCPSSLHFLHAQSSSHKVTRSLVQEAKFSAKAFSTRSIACNMLPRFSKATCSWHTDEVDTDDVM
jgi:hypothetical protein